MQDRLAHSVVVALVVMAVQLAALPYYLYCTIPLAANHKRHYLLY